MKNMYLVWLLNEVTAEFVSCDVSAECTKREINLVFLFDGSSSMKIQEFDMNKNFIKDVMKKLSNSSIKVKQSISNFTMWKWVCNSVQYKYCSVYWDYDNAVVCLSVCQFAAVQFSSKVQTVFDFNDYQNGSAEKKLKEEEHMKSLTNTYKAITHVLWVKLSHDYECSLNLHFKKKRLEINMDEN